MKNKKKLYATIFLLTIVMFFVSVYSYISYKQAYEEKIFSVQMMMASGLLEDKDTEKVNEYINLPWWFKSMSWFERGFQEQVTDRFTNLFDGKGFRTNKEVGREILKLFKEYYEAEGVKEKQKPLPQESQIEQPPWEIKDVESFLKGHGHFSLLFGANAGDIPITSKNILFNLQGYHSVEASRIGSEKWAKGTKSDAPQEYEPNWAAIYKSFLGFHNTFRSKLGLGTEASWYIRFVFNKSPSCTIRIYTGAKIEPLKCSIGKGSDCHVHIYCDFEEEKSFGKKELREKATGGYLELSDYTHGEIGAPVRGKIDVYKPNVFHLTGEFDLSISKLDGYPDYFTPERDKKERKKRKKKFIKFYKKLVTTLEKEKRPSALLPFGYPKPMEELDEYEKKEGVNFYLHKKSGRAFKSILFFNTFGDGIGYDYETVARLVDKHLDFKTLLYALQMGAKHASEFTGSFPISNFVNDTIYFSNGEYNAELYTKNKEGAEYWISFWYDCEAERWTVFTVWWLGKSLDSLDVKWRGQGL